MYILDNGCFSVSPDGDPLYRAGYAEHLNSWIVEITDKKMYAILDAEFYAPDHSEREKPGARIYGYFPKSSIDKVQRSVPTFISEEDLDKYL